MPIPASPGSPPVVSTHITHLSSGHGWGCWGVTYGARWLGTCLQQELCRLSKPLMAARRVQEPLHFLLLLVVWECKSVLQSSGRTFGLLPAKQAEIKVGTSLSWFLFMSIMWCTVVFVTQESFASGCSFPGMPVGEKFEPFGEAEVCNAISREDKMFFTTKGLRREELTVLGNSVRLGAVMKDLVRR